MPVSHADAMTDIATHFLTGWQDGAFSTIEIAWDNVDFDPQPDDPYVIFSIRPNDVRQATMAPVGNRKYRYWGIVMVGVCTPGHEGDGRNQRMVEQVVDILTGSATTNGVQILEPNLSRVGRVGPHFRQNVRFEYHFEKDH